MRIGFLADPLDTQYGGIHIYTKEILKSLSQIDKKNEYLVIRSQKSTNEFGAFEEVILPYSSYPGFRIWRTFVQVPKLLSKSGVDLVIEPAHFGPFNLPKTIKRITVIHDMTMFLFPEHHNFLSQFLQRKCLPGIIRKADHIITNSANTSNDLFRFFPSAQHKTTSILLGKDDFFQAQKDNLVLNGLGIEPPYMLYLGTLEPRKNITTLIQSFDDFKLKTGLPHQLVLAGKRGWKAKPIFDAIDQSPFKHTIKHLGYTARKDLPVLYSMAEFFVYPSLYEGFGLPVLEAMACGTPVITSNVSSLPEVGGKAAHYFSPDSTEQLTEKMILLAKNDAVRIQSSQLGLEQAAKFSWERTARATLKVFENSVRK